jgi:hypothetical protein
LAKSGIISTTNRLSGDGFTDTFSGARAPTQAYPIDTTNNISKLIEQFHQDGHSLEVSFRDMVSWIKVGERATHYIHPYPAKLLPQIAHFFLASNLLVGANEIVLDPFGGTGTVALEANLSGRNAYFADANPLARLIASVKTSEVDIDKVVAEASCLGEAYARTRRIKPPDVINLDKWYCEQVSRQLSRLHWSISDMPPGKNRDLFWVTFSWVARKVSNADPRLSVPVQLKEKRWANESFPNVWNLFLEQLQANIHRITSKRAITNGQNIRSLCVGNDARSLRNSSNWHETNWERLPDNSVGLIITSPPYAGAQKYIRASSLSLGWLGLASSDELKPLENKSIGREHLPKAISDRLHFTGIKSADAVLDLIYQKNPLRAAIAAIYINEMRDAVTEMARVLKPNGAIVMVIGNNEVCGYPFQSSDYMGELLSEAGLKPIVKLVDEIKSRGLMTKRNKTAGIISREWVLVYKKQ